MLPARNGPDGSGHKIHRTQHGARGDGHLEELLEAACAVRDKWRHTSPVREHREVAQHAVVHPPCANELAEARSDRRWRGRHVCRDEPQGVARRGVSAAQGRVDVSQAHAHVALLEDMAPSDRAVHVRERQKRAAGRVHRGDRGMEGIGDRTAQRASRAACWRRAAHCLACDLHRLGLHLLLHLLLDLLLDLDLRLHLLHLHLLLHLLLLHLRHMQQVALRSNARERHGAQARLGATRRCAHACGARVAKARRGRWHRPHPWQCHRAQVAAHAAHACKRAVRMGRGLVRVAGERGDDVARRAHLHPSPTWQGHPPAGAPAAPSAVAAHPAARAARAARASGGAACTGGVRAVAAWLGAASATVDAGHRLRAAHLSHLHGWHHRHTTRAHLARWLAHGLHHGGTPWARRASCRGHRSMRDGRCRQRAPARLLLRRPAARRGTRELPRGCVWVASSAMLVLIAEDCIDDVINPVAREGLAGGVARVGAV